MKIRPGSRSNTARLGKRGEDIAAEYLQQCGMTIITRNWKCRAGELDIAALEDDTLVFIEVKTIRRQSRFRPADNLSSYQRKRNCNAAKAYIRAMNISGKPSRFDLIEVTAGRFSFQLEHHKNYLPPLPPMILNNDNPPPPICAVPSAAAGILHRSCPACNAPSSGGRFCSDCIEKFNFFDPALRCPGCGGENQSTLEFCQLCLAEPERPWQYALSIFAYQGFARELIHRFKFRREPELARPFGMLAADLLISSGISADLLVPVPVSWLRYCLRTYNQAAMLADVISDFTRIPVYHALSRQISFRAKQSSLNRKERHRGLQNVFQVRKNTIWQGKNIILVDDVITTGATAAAAAALLMQQGAASVTLLTLGRTVAFSPHSFRKK